MAVTPADVVGSFAGLRPLAAGSDPSQRTADLSRRHLIDEGADGVITVYGGKLTTYRRMAEDAVDVVGRRLGVSARCRTRSTPLLGAAPQASLRTVAAPARLIRRFGTEAPQVAALADDDPNLLAPVAERVAGPRASNSRSACSPRARSPSTDLLERRTRLALVPADAELARPAAERIIERYGALLHALSRQIARMSRGVSRAPNRGLAGPPTSISRMARCRCPAYGASNSSIPSSSTGRPASAQPTTAGKW